MKPPLPAATRATPADDRSFETYDSAMALLTAPQREADVSVATGYLDVLFTYPIRSAGSRFSIEPTWARLGGRTVAVIQLILPSGAVRAFELGGSPGLVDLDPSWLQAAWRFVKLGFEHIGTFQDAGWKHNAWHAVDFWQKRFATSPEGPV